MKKATLEQRFQVWVAEFRKSGGDGPQPLMATLDQTDDQLREIWLPWRRRGDRYAREQQRIKAARAANRAEWDAYQAAQKEKEHGQ